MLHKNTLKMNSTEPYCTKILFFQSNVYSTFMYHICYCDNMESDKKHWKERHFKIAKESAEKFKTHTEDQEVDI